MQTPFLVYHSTTQKFPLHKWPNFHPTEVDLPDSEEGDWRKLQLADEGMSSTITYMETGALPSGENDARKTALNGVLHRVQPDGRFMLCVPNPCSGRSCLRKGCSLDTYGRPSSTANYNVTSGGQGCEDIYGSGVTPALHVRLASRTTQPTSTCTYPCCRTV